jgi:ATP-dependent RNA helicase HelY
VKFNGEQHADVTAGEYTQLTGRAGRRGIDVEGHAIVIWQPGMDPAAVAGLASTRTYPLRSSFRPTYNMAVNLVAQFGRARAREILETSFAQFQADRAVVGLARQLRRQEEALDGYAEAMTCHLGDFAEYARLRRRITDLEKQASKDAARRQRADAVASLEGLRIGDVIRVPAGRRAGFAVVLDPGAAGGFEGPRPTVLTADRQVRRLSVVDVPAAVEPVGRVKVPRNFNPRNAAARRDLASSLRNALSEGRISSAEVSPRPGRRGGEGWDDEIEGLRRELRRHPCHGCAEREDHARWAERHWRLARDTEALGRRIEGRTNTIARVFDRVCDLLADLGYLSGTGDDVAVTAAGERLRRIYSERDLLVAECLRSGVWDPLDPAGLAAVVAAVVYEARRETEGVAAPVPGGAVRQAAAETVRIWSGLHDREAVHRLQQTDEPDLDLVLPVHRWASGARLDDVLADADLAAGDFVRWCRQVLDLLDQIADATGDVRLRKVAHAAAAKIDRGVVAYSAGGVRR